MEPPIFYTPDAQPEDQSIPLPKAEARHAVEVMRLVDGAQVVAVDGHGNAYRGILNGARRRSKPTTVEAVQRVRGFGEPMARVTLAAGLSVGSKFDNVVQRGTELGVTRFVPLLTQKAKVKMDDPKRQASRQRRLSKVAVAAMKQCRRSRLPEVSVPVTLNTVLQELESIELKLLLHPSPASSSLEKSFLGRSVPQSVAILVGPESGFSDDEIEVAQAAGFIRVGLGPRILRTETAAPAACALVMSALGELA